MDKLAKHPNLVSLIDKFEDDQGVCPIFRPPPRAYQTLINNGFYRSDLKIRMCTPTIIPASANSRCSRKGSLPCWSLAQPDVECGCRSRFLSKNTTLLLFPELILIFDLVNGGELFDYIVQQGKYVSVWPL